MVPDAKAIRRMYMGKFVNHYDWPISLFDPYKELAFADSSLKRGDSVLVFCCGTGLDFPHILKKIGKEGRIVGVDFSSEMLARARMKLKKNNWDNIELVEADVADFGERHPFDAGVCSFGISIIAEYEKAYKNLLAHVKPQGEIIIIDMLMASGWLAVFNPVTVWMVKRLGGTYEGHRNSTDLCFRMQKELDEIRRKEFFLQSFFCCIGKKKPSPEDSGAQINSSPYSFETGLSDR